MFIILVYDIDVKRVGKVMLTPYTLEGKYSHFNQQTRYTLVGPGLNAPEQHKTDQPPIEAQVNALTLNLLTAMQLEFEKIYTLLSELKAKLNVE